MPQISLIPTIEALEKYFDILNEKFFESALSKPIITLHEGHSKHAFGWLSIKPRWINSHTCEEYIELNISCDYLDRNYSSVLETLHHEMIHLWNLQHNIQDVSRSSQYHNREFKKACEEHGLEAQKAPKAGYISKAPDKTIKIYEEIRNDDITGLFRKRSETADKAKKKSSTRKYVCPVCGASVRATKEVNIICGDCNEKMTLSE